MECEQVREIIPIYINHNVSEEETKKVEEHLCICHDCRLFLTNLIDNKPKIPKQETISTPSESAEKIGVLEWFVLGVGISIFLGLIYLLLLRS
jgi:predicted anti-sigma-YlaC factor YlaD